MCRFDPTFCFQPGHGRNLAESFYAAMPYLSWQTLIVATRCAPFRTTRSPPMPPTCRSTP
jgi:hypothetical protein